MPVEVSKLGTVFGDRLVVKKLERPETVRGLYVPSTYSKEKTKESDLWWGIVERFGLDSKIGDAYGVEVGDLVGFEAAGLHCSSFEGEDGFSRVWVAEEFAAVKDLGRVAAFREGKEWTNEEPGLQPLGSRVAILPDAVEEKTKSGLYIPDEAKDNTNIGTAIAVSLGAISGSEIDALVINVGDTILYGKYSGCYARLGKCDILLSKQEDVIATYTKEKEVANVG